MGAVMATLLAGSRRPPSVGRRGPLHWSVRHRGADTQSADAGTHEPPSTPASPEMGALGRYLRAGGPIYVRAVEFIFTNPPLCMSEEQLREGFAIIDRGLAIADAAVT